MGALLRNDRFGSELVRGRCSRDDVFALSAQIKRLLERKPIMGAVLRGEALLFLHRDRRSACTSSLFFTGWCIFSWICGFVLVVRLGFRTLLE